MNKTANDSGHKLFIAAIAVIAAMFLIIIFSARESPRTAEADTPDITEIPPTLTAETPALSTHPPDSDDTASEHPKTTTPPHTTAATHSAKATVHTAVAQPAATQTSPPIPPPEPIPHIIVPDTIVITPQQLEMDTVLYYERFQAAKTIEAVKFTPLAIIVRNHPSPTNIREIVIPLPNGNSIPMTVTQHNVIDVDRGVFSGLISDQPLSEVIVAYYRDAITASIIIPGKGHYEIAPTGDGNHLLIEIDPDKILPEAQPLIPPVDGDD